MRYDQSTSNAIKAAITKQLNRRIRVYDHEEIARKCLEQALPGYKIIDSKIDKKTKIITCTIELKAIDYILFSIDV